MSDQSDCYLYLRMSCDLECMVYRKCLTNQHWPMRLLFVVTTCDSSIWYGKCCNHKTSDQSDCYL